MKKVLSLLIVLVMLFAALSMVACGDDEPVVTTPAPSTEVTTTAAPVTTTTAAPVTTTTAAPVTTTTAAPVTTTTAAPVTTTTAAPVTTTTEAPVTTTTTAAPVETTTTKAPAASTGTTEAVFARFDFGTKSYAVDNNLTSHEYLVAGLKYNDEYVYIEWDDDNLIVYATVDYNYNTMKDNTQLYSLAWDDLSATYEFEDPQQIHIGYGSWANYPYSTAKSSWKGFHQYMQIRFINGSANQMISLDFSSNGMGGSYFTTSIAAFTVDAGKAESTYATYQTKTFDMTYCAQSTTGGTELTASNGKTPGNNWTWRGDNDFVNALRFHFLGAMSRGNARDGATWATSGSSSASGKSVSWTAGNPLTQDTVIGRYDSRGMIKAGNFVKVDYVIWGASVESCDEYKSYIEKAAK